MENLLKRPRGKTVYVVYGQSYAGKLTRRDGKTVTCGHNHKTRATAKPCERALSKSRPGRCQTYSVEEVVVVRTRRKK